MPIPIIWDKPITIWLGILVFCLLVATFSIGLLRFKRIIRVSINVHRNLGILTILAALVHGYFAFVAYFL